MKRDILDIITSKLLKCCSTHQNNKYGNGGCLIFWDTISKPDHPYIYWFVRKTKLGKWIEQRWVKRAHKRIAV